tara:strand:+ start:192 stop:395 length:204 start_codon:yes stop_codon:yes gene_type:complete
MRYDTEAFIVDPRVYFDGEFSGSWLCQCGNGCLSGAVPEDCIVCGVLFSSEPTGGCDGEVRLQREED